MVPALSPVAMSRRHALRAGAQTRSSASVAAAVMLLLLAGSAAALRPLPGLEEAALAASAVSSANAALPGEGEDLNLRPLIGIVSQVQPAGTHEPCTSLPPGACSRRTRISRHTLQSMPCPRCGSRPVLSTAKEICSVHA